MGYKPFNYEQLNCIEGGYTPSSVHTRNNKAFAFWERALFQRAISVIDFTLPDTWKGTVRDFFYYVMFRFGHCVVFKHDEYGIIFQPCNLRGFDIYYQPTNATIANPHFKSLDLEIGKDCGVLKISPDFYGIYEICAYYAEKLALLDNAVNISLINNKFAFMLGAKNKAAGEALKKMLDKINKGEPAVIFDMKLANDPNSKDEPWQFWNRGNLKDTYLTSMQLADFQTILHNFDTEIGIPTLPIEKKERMITDEANMRSIDAISRSKIWVDCFNESAEVVNKLYGYNISAKLNYERSEDNGEPDVNRNV